MTESIDPKIGPQIGMPNPNERDLTPVQRFRNAVYRAANTFMGETSVAVEGVSMEWQEDNSGIKTVVSMAVAFEEDQLDAESISIWPPYEPFFGEKGK